MTVERAFEVPSLVINDRGGILSGDADPAVPGLNAPVGSLYMRTDGRHYRKTGGLDTDWGETDLGGGGSGGFNGLGLWRYRTETANNPSSGRLQFNNTDVDLATSLYVNVTNDGGVDMTNFIGLITDGDLIYIQDSTSASKFIVCEVQTGILLSGVYTFPIVAVESQGAAITNNTQTSFVASHSGGPGELQFFNRAGASENIDIIFTTQHELPFFNRAGGSENIGII